MPGIAVITMETEVEAGTMVSLKLSVTVRGALVVEPAAGIDATTLICARADADIAVNDAASTKARGMKPYFIE
jgi:hypothetical protein